VSVRKRGRRSGDPVASLTLFRDHPEASGHPDVAATMAALTTLYPADDFRVDHRAMVVDGESFVVFDVFRRDGG
jgi:hypothetical protein